MLMSVLLIHLSGGRIETHFHIFGSLAFLGSTGTGRFSSRPRSSWPLTISFEEFTGRCPFTASRQ